jgi:hypothetical protein
MMPANPQSSWIVLAIPNIPAARDVAVMYLEAIDLMTKLVYASWMMIAGSYFHWIKIS